MLLVLTVLLQSSCGSIAKEKIVKTASKNQPHFLLSNDAVLGTYRHFTTQLWMNSKREDYYTLFQQPFFPATKNSMREARSSK